MYLIEGFVSDKKQIHKLTDKSIKEIFDLFVNSNPVYDKIWIYDNSNNIKYIIHTDTKQLTNVDKIIYQKHKANFNFKDKWLHKFLKLEFASWDTYFDTKQQNFENNINELFDDTLIRLFKTYDKNFESLNNYFNQYYSDYFTLDKNSIQCFDNQKLENALNNYISKYGDVSIKIGYNNLENLVCLDSKTIQNPTLIFRASDLSEYNNKPNFNGVRAFCLDINHDLQAFDEANDYNDSNKIIECYVLPKGFKYCNVRTYKNGYSEALIFNQDLKEL